MTIDTERLERVLRYAKDRVKHPEDNGLWPQVCYTDGLSIRQVATVESVRAEADARIKRLEAYEQYVKDIDILLAALPATKP